LNKDLFSYKEDQELHKNAPLADRLRPRNLEEFIGQSSILAEGRLLHRAIKADSVGNLILYGPPGVGKTTLAKIIASNTLSHFSVLNAVLAGVKDLRVEIENARNRLSMYGTRTILFIDEVHRFNTAQQDALLPWVENGTLTLIGATTNNPYFEVNKALLSRSRLFRLEKLAPEDLHQLVKRALNDSQNGYGDKNVNLLNDAANHLVNISNGDARSLLNALELAIESTPPNAEGLITIDLLIAEESIQERAILYDKQGDAHFDTISAFIKSLRGSDPDAALFWLARMIEGGEQPKYIFRRMLISASEDIGLADPQAIVVVEACAKAFDRVGLPEGLYSLAQAALYLANTDKSNSIAGFFEAQKIVRKISSESIPNHLRDSHKDQLQSGDGIGYKYPHLYPDHWVEQQYLPDLLNGTIFWRPTTQGWEGKKKTQILKRRAAQIAVIEESKNENPLLSIVDNDPKLDSVKKWAFSNLFKEEQRFENLAKKLWENIIFKRNDRVLIIIDSSILWAFSPIQSIIEGGVTIVTSSTAYLEKLALQLEFLDPIYRPTLISGFSKLNEGIFTNQKFEIIAGRINLQEKSQKEIEFMIESISSKSTLGTKLIFLFSFANIGPARALKSLIEKNKVSFQNIHLLDELIDLENTWLDSNRNEKKLLETLEQFGWEINLDKWEENLSLILDNKIVSRWFDKKQTYYKLLKNNVSQEVLDIVRQLLNTYSGYHLDQQLIHFRVRANLTR